MGNRATGLILGLVLVSLLAALLFVLTRSEGDAPDREARRGVPPHAQEAPGAEAREEESGPRDASSPRTAGEPSRRPEEAPPGRPAEPSPQPAESSPELGADAPPEIRLRLRQSAFDAGACTVEVLRRARDVTVDRSDPYSVTMARARASHPRYYNRLARHAPPPERDRRDHPSIQRALGKGVTSISVPFEGTAIVTVFSDTMIPDVRVVSLERGDVVEMDVSPRAKPEVTGRLVAAGGRPMAGETVTVAAVSTFRPDELLPVTPREGGPEIKNLADTMDLEEPFDVSAKLEVTTDERGEFRARMPFTDRVTVYAFPDGYSRALAEVRARGREGSVRDLLLEAEPLGDQPRMRLVDEDRRPVHGVAIRFVEIGPDRSNPVVEMPWVRPDAEGWVEIGRLDPSKKHYLLCADPRYAGAEFTPEPGGTILVQ